MSVLSPGKIEEIAPGVRRLVAPNGGMMTGPGTNTYLIGEEAIACIDPGPSDASHLEQIARHCDGRLRWILASHTHRDHSPGVAPLARITGAQIVGARGPVDSWNDATFLPDLVPKHNERLIEEPFVVRAIATPGHASNHFCYLLEDQKMLFTGDHIMNGSTVVIAPPDGNMIAYLDSLALLKEYDIRFIAPGHGDVLEDPDKVVDWIIEHRLQREKQVWDAVAASEPATIEALVLVVYAEVDPRLHGMAQRSLEAHLNKLQTEGRVTLSDNRWKTSEPDELTKT